MGKTALITGITGQDGSYLAEILLKKGYKVPYEVKVGDYVYFNWFDATRKLKVKDEFYILLTQQEILLVEEEDG